MWKEMSGVRVDLRGKPRPSTGPQSSAGLGANVSHFAVLVLLLVSCMQGPRGANLAAT